jgi:hypothetical protein
VAREALAGRDSRKEDAVGCLGSAGQERYERGRPMVTATTMTATRRAVSAPAVMRRGSWES